MNKEKNRLQKSQAKTSVNPQGLPEDVADMQPKSQLEQRVKKKNTKI